MTIHDSFVKYSSKIDHLDLELLIAHALKKSREFVLAHPEQSITKNQETIIKQTVNRCIKGKPLAYILGHKEFFGLDFKVDKNTLIPRPETELLVELAIQELAAKHPASPARFDARRASRQQPTTVVDIGTGSGNIIISIAKAMGNTQHPISNIHFFATDISSETLKIAKQNAKAHGVDKKIKFLRGNLLEPIFKTTNYKLQTTNYIILANLPYLDNDWKNLLKSSDTSGLKYEPKIALYAGKDGLDAYRKLAEQIKLFAANCELSTTIFCEIGHLQKKGMEKIFSFASRIKFKKDLAKKWRVCMINS